MQPVPQSRAMQLQCPHVSRIELSCMISRVQDVFIVFQLRGTTDVRNPGGILRDLGVPRVSDILIYKSWRFLCHYRRKLNILVSFGNPTILKSVITSYTISQLLVVLEEGPLKGISHTLNFHNSPRFET